MSNDIEKVKRVCGPWSFTALLGPSALLTVPGSAVMARPGAPILGTERRETTLKERSLQRHPSEGMGHGPPNPTQQPQHFVSEELFLVAVPLKIFPRQVAVL